MNDEYRDAFEVILHATEQIYWEIVTSISHDHAMPIDRWGVDGEFLMSLEVDNMYKKNH